MRLSPEVSAAVFCAAITSSRCRPEDTPGIQWPRDDGDFVRVYRTDVPWKPLDYQGGHHRHQDDFSFVAWVAVLSVAVSATCLVLLSCACWRLCTSRGTGSRSPDPATAFRADGVFGPPGSIYGTGVMNFAFTGSLQDREDKPPEYSSVVGEASPDKQPPSCEDKPPLETPPPAYVSVSVAPFPDSPK